MAVPKRKISKTAKRTRRAVWYNKIKMAPIHKCNNCGETKIQHHVCPSCGQYDGRLVLNIAE
jgi:large subunit ribosomal protein L32